MTRLAAVLCLLAVIAAGLHPGPARADQRSEEALAMSLGAIGSTLPDLTFRRAGGDEVSIAELSGRPLLISLIYTACTDVCPTVVASLGPAVDAAREALGKDSFSVLTVGFDVRNDTPERMLSFARAQGAGAPNWHFAAAADQDTLDRLARAVGFGFYASAGGFDHMAQITVVDKAGRIYRQVYGASFDVPTIVEPLKELVFGRERPFLSVDGLVDRVKLFCTVYNPNTGRYYFNYSLFAAIGMGLSALLAVFAFLVREVRRHYRVGGS